MRTFHSSNPVFEVLLNVSTHCYNTRPCFRSDKGVCAPIYAYQCNVCEHEVEALQKMGDAPMVTCEACNEDKMQTLFRLQVFV